jgi:hypothetical protein
MDKIKQNIENCREILNKEYNSINNNIIAYDYPYRLQNIINMHCYIDCFYDILESMDAFSTNLDDFCFLLFEF